MKVLNETTGDQETTSIRDPLSYGTVWAEFIDDIETGTLQPMISQKVLTWSVVCSDIFKAYTGIAAR